MSKTSTAGAGAVAAVAVVAAGLSSPVYAGMFDFMDPGEWFGSDRGYYDDWYWDRYRWGGPWGYHGGPWGPYGGPWGYGAPWGYPYGAYPYYPPATGGGEKSEERVPQ